MSWEAVIAIANVVMAIGVPATIILTWWGINQGAKNQLYVQYVTRYENIVTHLPPETLDKGNKIESVSKEQEVWLTAYIDLCEEETLDYNRGAIGGDTWKDWSGFIIGSFLRSLPLRKRFVRVIGDYPKLLEVLNKA